jgi:hypothetical protein
MVDAYRATKKMRTNIDTDSWCYENAQARSLPQTQDTHKWNQERRWQWDIISAGIRFTLNSCRFIPLQRSNLVPKSVIMFRSVHFATFDMM